MRLLRSKKLQKVRILLLLAITIYAAYHAIAFTRWWSSESRTTVSIAWQIYLFPSLPEAANLLEKFRAPQTNNTTEKTSLQLRSFKFDDTKYKLKTSYRNACKYYYCDKDFNLTYSSAHSPMTLVTAYFNLGTFKKGNDNKTYSTQLYYSWIDSFSLVMNDVLVFSDDVRFMSAFKRSREGRPQRSCYCFVRREALWPFRLVPVISEVLKQPGYPQFHPNTVLPEYGASMHAKYAVMELALEWNPFKADYIGWIDVGIFRDLVNTSDSAWAPQVTKSYCTEHQPFYLDLPREFDESRVAFNQVEHINYSGSISRYFESNEFWIGGGFFFARRAVMLKWINQYRRTVLELLKQGLSNTDQQVLCAMFHPTMINNTRVHPNLAEIIYTQNYRKSSNDTVNSWFYLAFKCRQSWFIRVHNVSCDRVQLNIVDCLEASLATSRSTYDRLFYTNFVLCFSLLVSLIFAGIRYSF